MALPQPIAVAAAVAGGVPTDVREWVVVDVVGSPSSHRRGYAILVEPVSQDGRAAELAHQVRDVLLHELRLHARQAPDAALVHAFGVANGLIHDDLRNSHDFTPLVGATAIVFEGHTATIAHVPPGQVVLIQDRLVYGVPELDSRLPRWAAPSDSVPAAEPFGYANWVAPILVQTELLPGDAIVLCDEATAGVLAQASQPAASNPFSFRSLFAQNPDVILDSVRSLTIAANEPFAAIAVISFPPNPVTSEIESLTDVARNAREQLRHARAAFRSVKPRMPARKQATQPLDTNDETHEQLAPAIPQPRLTFQERLLRMTEGRSTEGGGTWQPRRPETQFGAPGAHGVRRHRRVTGMGNDLSWKSGVPRAPFIGSPVFLGIVLIAVFLVGVLIWNQRDIFSPDEREYAPVLAQVDQRLHAADTLKDDAAILSELDEAGENLADASSLGAPKSEIEQRELAITEKRDDVLGIFRVSDVYRIGSLPDDLKNENTAAYWTPGGIFLANGNLYRLNPETAEMQLMLEQGREIEGIRVGDLYGVAYDGTFLVVSDGRALFFASSTDGAIWQSMSMEEINNQGPWQPGPLAAFGESVYLMESEFRNIYAFTLDANQQIVAPVDWVSQGDRVNLNIGVDMAIDGNIYVLLEDGQVVTFRGGLETGRFDLPGFDLETDTPVAIVNGTGTGYLYVAVIDEDGNGRVIATDKSGQNSVILELPVDFDTGNSDWQDPFEGLQSIVVDEDLGRMYLINGDAIWSFGFTLPALPDAGTPEATQED